MPGTIAIPQIGRPKAFNSLEEFITPVNQYIQELYTYNTTLKKGSKPKPLTVVGLCNFIGIHKDTFYEYMKKPDYTDSLKKTSQVIEQYVADGILTGEVNVIGGIFNLKNNFGRSDKIETTNINVQVNTKDLYNKSLKQFTDDAEVVSTT